MDKKNIIDMKPAIRQSLEAGRPLWAEEDDPLYQERPHTILNRPQWERYRELCAKAQAFAARCGDILEFTVAPEPNPFDPFAKVWLKLKALSYIAGEDAAALTELFSLSDDISFIATQEPLTVALIVNNIWLD